MSPKDADATGVTLRLSVPRDAKTLDELESMNARRLGDGAVVVAEVDGKIVAALPLGGGEPLIDFFVRTAHLVPLLELRAEQIRHAAGRAGPRPRFRLIARLIPARG